MHQIVPNRPNDTKVYLHMENEWNDEEEVDLLNVAEHMQKKKKLYKYMFAMAVCLGILFGIIFVGAEYIAGQNSYARAVISFQYEGIEEGLDPNGAAFDINKIKSPAVIEDALNTLNITGYGVEEIREKIAIEGVIPEDAVERITLIKEMALEDASNYEKIMDVTYFPSQYIIYLYKDMRMPGRKAVQILDAVLESYRKHFFDTYANTGALTVTGKLIDYTVYDYAEALDMIETQIGIMQDYVTERRTDAPQFRSVATGLSFGDIAAALDTLESIDISNLNSYIESHMLTKDRDRQREYYEYRINKFNMEISEKQVQLSNVQSVIDAYQKDPVVIVSSQETTQQLEQTNEYYDQLLQQKLNLSAEIAAMNTSLNKTYALLNAINQTDKKNVQDEYDYADGKMDLLAQTIAKWIDLTEQTTQEYYETELFSNAYKIGMPAKYRSAGGIADIAKKIAVSVAVMVFAVLAVWCMDGLLCELRRIRENRR